MRTSLIRVILTKHLNIPMDDDDFKKLARAYKQMKATSWRQMFLDLVDEHERTTKP
jgi:hypothetical protein